MDIKCILVTIHVQVSFTRTYDYKIVFESQRSIEIAHINATNLPSLKFVNVEKYG